MAISGQGPPRPNEDCENKEAVTMCTNLQSNLRCFYTNADSLRNKLPELELRLKDPYGQTLYDVVAIAETNSKTKSFDTSDCELNIPGVQLFCNNQSVKSRGVAIYVSNQHKVNPISPHSDYTDSVFVSVKTSDD